MADIRALWSQGFLASRCSGSSKCMNPTLALPTGSLASPHRAGQAVHANDPVLKHLIPYTVQLKKLVMIGKPG